MCIYSTSLDELLQSSGVEKQSTYTPRAVAKIMSISYNSVIMLCDTWTPITFQGLESYRVGTHRRIPHHSIVCWLKNNSSYELLRN